MLQPVMIVPSSVSRAAPTLKPEKGATACNRASVAVAIKASVRAAERLTGAPRRRFSDAANDALQQAHEVRRDALRGLHHLRVIERLGQHAGSHVRDAGDAE